MEGDPKEAGFLRDKRRFDMLDTTAAHYTEGSEPGINAESLVAEHGDYLFRYAVSRTGDESFAEDLVQETLLAALRSGRRSGGSSLRTWLTAILKHKIVDEFRKSVRECQLLEDDEFELGQFREDGHWKKETAPVAWTSCPETEFEKTEFRKVLLESLGKLPRRHAAVFVLREIEEMTTEEICSELNISSSNVWVLLHRARLQLRALLEEHWFGRDEVIN